MRKEDMAPLAWEGRIQVLYITAQLYVHFGKGYGP